MAINNPMSDPAADIIAELQAELATIKAKAREFVKQSDEMLDYTCANSAHDYKRTRDELIKLLEE